MLFLHIRRPLIFITLLLLSNFLFAQENILDSLQKKLSGKITPKEKAITLLNISSVYANTDLKEAIRYAQKARKTATSNKLKEEQIRANNALGYVYMRLGKYYEAEKYHQIALKHSKKYKLKKFIVAGYANLANVNYSLKHTKDAIEYGLKALKIYERLEDEKSIARVQSNLGSYLNAAGHKQKAIDYFKKSLKLKEKLNDTQGIVSNLNNLGDTYGQIGELQKAIETLERAEKIAQKGNYLFKLSITYTTFGLTYDEQKEHRKAQEYHEKALAISQKIGDMMGVIINSENLGKNLYHQNQLTEAIDYMEKAIKIAQEGNYIEHIINIKEDLSEAYAKNGDMTTAYRLAKEFAQAQDSLNQVEQKEVIADMQTRYETEKKNKEIEILTKENKINELTIHNQRKSTYWLIGLTTLLLLLGVLLWNRYLIKIKTEKILEEKNTELQKLNAIKDKLFATIAHDLKNPLSGFRAITQSLSTNLADISKEDIDYFLQELNHSAQKLFNLLQNLLNWAISQIDRLPFQPENIDVKEVFTKNVDVLKMNVEQKQLQIEYQVPENLQVYADKNMLRSILLNLVSNAIKFSEEGQKITLIGQRENGKLALKVQDEGLGMSQEDVEKLFKIDEDVHSIGDSEEKGTGLGLILCKELAEKQGGSIHCISELGKGSTFLVKLPPAST